MGTCLIERCDLPVHGRGLCVKHYGQARYRGALPPIPTFIERFWTRVDKATETSCWTWTGAINGHGYGNLRVDGRVRGAHRVAYELSVGPIPEGMELDHLCHSADPDCAGGTTCIHRRCVNPAHLEPVTQFVNWQRGKSPHALDARKTHCTQGHEFTPENTRVYPYRNQRVCLTCKRAAARETASRVPKEKRNTYMREYRARKRTS